MHKACGSPHAQDLRPCEATRAGLTRWPAVVGSAGMREPIAEDPLELGLRACGSPSAMGLHASTWQQPIFWTKISPTGGLESLRRWRINEFVKQDEIRSWSTERANLLTRWNNSLITWVARKFSSSTNGFRSEKITWHLEDLELLMSVYSKGVSVLMPGHNIPTFIAHPTPPPAPDPCSPERIRWPSHQHNPFTTSDPL
ncbi:hypothetical protein ACMD2_26167 [Ananas comosus]|uniref:Uncharacterized protein n=1 Tax=Ananas comosus TaxID=4615 RepID=A0A199VMA1_ANACO|nr:hypothetical protein ACMD2_26167 [Ananas comosus]